MAQTTGIRYEARRKEAYDRSATAKRTMQYTTRPATGDDCEAMMRIGHEGIRPYVEELWGWDQADQEARFREHFDPELFSIVQVDGIGVGYLKVEHRDDHVFLAGIFIDAGHRRRGLGSQLISDLIAQCRSDGLPLRLRVLRPNPCHQLYRRLGFEEIGATEAHIMMEHRHVS
jgi:GNAT superfamily N-acetyltransferase